MICVITAQGSFINSDSVVGVNFKGVRKERVFLMSNDGFATGS